MNLIIRKGQKQDVPQVLGLIRELAEFENAPNEVKITEQEMEQNGFGDNPVFKMLVAQLDQKVIGTAIYFIKYSTWKGRGVYLDDLIVNEQHRGKGIGKALFDALVKESIILGARQLHWQVLNWNEPAIKFYQNYDATFDSEWVNCKLNEHQLKEIAMKR